MIVKSFHLTQRLLLHYVRKSEQAKYYIFILRQYDYLNKITHIEHILSYLSLWLTVYPTVNVRNIGPLSEHRHADVFFPFVDSSVDIFRSRPIET